MDVVKSWLLAGVVMIMSDFVLTFIVPANYTDVHLLSPILAGFAAASFSSITRVRRAG